MSNPLRAPRWLQPYLDCVDCIHVGGTSDPRDRTAVIRMFRGGREVGLQRVEVPIGPEAERHRRSLTRLRPR